ncbi:MAG: hypothetical protein ACFFCZ_18875 [Promethearchaeota archaeon]
MSFIKNVAKKSFFLKVLGILILLQSLFFVNTFIIAQDTPQNLYNQYGLINDQVLIHFLETPINKSAADFRGATTLVGTTLYSLVANGSRTNEVLLLKIDFNEQFTAIESQEMYSTPLGNEKTNYGLATNNSHFWVIEYEGTDNKTIDLDNKTYHLCYYKENIVGFTLDGNVFLNRTLTFDELYTPSYLQELTSYDPWGLPECPDELPYPQRIEYWDQQLYILEGRGFWGFGILQLNANSLKRESLKTMAFQNYGQYYVHSYSRTFDIDDAGTLWTESWRTKWIDDSSLREEGRNIYRYNMTSGERLEIVEENPASLGNLTDYDFINSTYYRPSLIIGASRLEIEREASFNIGKDNKIIKLLSAEGDYGTTHEFVEMIIGFLVYSFNKIPFTYPWSSPLFWGGGIGLCLALVAVILVRDRYFLNKSQENP